MNNELINSLNLILYILVASLLLWIYMIFQNIKSIIDLHKSKMSYLKEIANLGVYCAGFFAVIYFILSEVSINVPKTLFGCALLLFACIWLVFSFKAQKESKKTKLTAPDGEVQRNNSAVESSQ